MCGIAGILNLDGRPADASRLERMVRTLGHRGPDAMSYLTDAACGLAHTRLSIIDVEGGHQPMSHADGRLSITFNGEIFNYIELRKDLSTRGHRFATRSDTEVILHLYEEYGEDCVRHMNGQWAFAIWDAHRRKMFLSRDRMGVRPLFYTVANGAFVFGSEIKAILASGLVTPALDPGALDQLFTFWTPLPGRTMFRNIAELPAGHSLTVNGDEPTIRRYWHPEYTTLSEVNEDAAAGQLLDLLIDATRIRLRADVPVGAYLSGGLDSTIITAIIKRFTTTPLRSFSLGFEDVEFDESSHQRQVTEFLETDHEAVHCTNDDIAQIFPKVVYHAEKPMLRTAPAPMMLLSRLVRDRGYKVVLTGEGSDEVFGGYDIFKETKIRRFWSKFPGSKIRPALLRRLYPYMKNIQAQPEAYLRAFFRTSAEDCADPFFSHLPRWSLTAKLKLFYAHDFRTQIGAYDPLGDLSRTLPPTFSEWDSFTQAQYLETAHLLPGYILSSQGDRMGMANSVEGRFPFLDHRVVQFAASLPPRLKMKVLNEKYLLKRAVRGLIPEAVRSRKKQPYRAPDAKSFFGASGKLVDYADDLLAPRRLAEDGIFNPAAVERLVAKARTGQDLGTKDNMAFVGILSTQSFVHQFIRTSTHAESSERHPAIHRRELPVRAAR
jgi:asparagine synthase (glutamine-hydrolysing)